MISLYSTSLPSTASHAGSAAPSTFSSISSGLELSNTKQNLTLKEVMIAETLGIDRDLTREKPPVTLQDYFKRYTTCCDACSKIKETSGWDTGLFDSGRIAPTERDVIELFIGKTAWHNSWTPKFKAVITKYPLMQQWLEGDVSGPTTKEVWGVDNDESSFKLKDLETWIRNGGQSVNLKGKAKAGSTSPAKAGGSGGGSSDIAKKSKKKKKVDEMAR